MFMDEEIQELKTPSPHVKNDLPKGKVNLRQLRMINNIPLAKTIKEAAVMSGYSAKSGSEVMKRIESNQSLSSAFSEAGLSPRFLAEVYAEIISVGKPFEKLKALELISKIRGDFAPTKTLTATASLEDIIIAAHNNQENDDGADDQQDIPGDN